MPITKLASVGAQIASNAVIRLALIFCLLPLQALSQASQQQQSPPNLNTGNQEVQQPTPSQDELTIFPKRGVPGKNYTVTIVSKLCKLKDSTLSVYNDISKMETEIISTDGCTMTAKIAIAADAVLDTNQFNIKDADGKIQPIEFAVKEKPPGPIPPGIDAQADVMWAVLAKRAVNDNFGRKVANEYYCIEVTIGNNTGYDLQIANVGFTVPALTKKAAAYDKQDKTDKEDKPKRGYIIPANNYKITRGTIEWEQRRGARNFTVNLIKGLGPFLTGFVPYFHDTNHRANFSEGVNIFSNPFEKGFELVYPDRTVRNLDRLEDQVLREGLIIPNNTHEKTYKVFLPKDFLKSLMEERHKVTPLTDEIRNDPIEVMLELGELVLIGYRVEHINRVQVISRPITSTQTNTAEVELFGDQFIAQGEEKELLFNGSFADNAQAKFVNANTGLEIKKKTVSDGGKVLKLRVNALDDAAIQDQPIQIESKGEITRQSVKVQPGVPEATLAYDDGEPSENPAREQDIQATITGKHLSGVTITPTGNAVGKIKATIQRGATATEIPVLITVTPKATQGDYDLVLKNDNREGKTVAIKFTVKPQPSPDNLEVFYKESGPRQKDPPKANSERDQDIVIIVKGDNLDAETKIIDPLPEASQGKLEVKSQKIRKGNLRAEIKLKKRPALALIRL